MTTNTTTTVAVYGTLRNGYGNHWLWADDPQCTARPGTHRVAGFAMYSAWNGGFPYAVPDPEFSIVAELIDVTPECMERLDRLEGYPHHYDRKVVVATTEDGGTIEAWMYFAPAQRAKEIAMDCPIVPSGDWADIGSVGGWDDDEDECPECGGWDGWRCHWCGAPATEADHLLERGGWDGEHADDCDAAEPLYREPWPEEP